MGGRLRFFFLRKKVPADPSCYCAGVKTDQHSGLTTALTKPLGLPFERIKTNVQYLFFLFHFIQFNLILHSILLIYVTFIHNIYLKNLCVIILYQVKCTVVQALRLCTGHTSHSGSRGIALLFLGHGTRRGEGSASRPGRSLPPGKTRYPLYRRLGGPQGRSGQVRKISPPSGFNPRTIQPVASRYTD